MTTKTTWLLYFLLATITITVSANEPSRAHLNVVHIIADDLNTDLSCYGHSFVKTPNIDRLASHGVRFDRAYCNYPVCNPSRTSLLSGKRPETTGIVDNVTPTRTHLKESVMLPQLFRQNGWLTQEVGKIFHTGDEFEDPPSWDFDLRETTESKQPPKEQILQEVKGEGIVLSVDDADTWDGKVARKAVELIEKAVRGGKPFYAAVGFRRPHSPYIAPRKYFDLYPSASLTWPAEPSEHVARIPPLALTYQAGKPALTEARRAKVMSAYFASISFMDAQVGVVLDAIDRLNLWDRTIVVFHGDHGYHHGEHGGLWHKMTLFEEGVRVPLIVAAPGKKHGVVSRRLVELVDLYPTLADLSGLKALPISKDLVFSRCLMHPKGLGRRPPLPWSGGERLPTWEVMVPSSMSVTWAAPCAPNVGGIPSGPTAIRSCTTKTPTLAITPTSRIGLTTPTPEPSSRRCLRKAGSPRCPDRFSQSR